MHLFIYSKIERNSSELNTLNGTIMNREFLFLNRKKATSSYMDSAFT